MDWNNFVFLTFVIVMGYIPYKFTQKIRTNGLRNISLKTALFLTFWFIVFSTLLLSKIYPIEIKSTFWVNTIFTVTTFTWLITPRIVPKIGTRPNQTKSNSLRYTWELDPKTYYMKYFEVIFQQIKFIFLIEVVLINFNLFDRILWFTILIVLVHLGNLFFLPKKEALIFTVLSLPMAIVFGILIDKGYVLLTTTIHLWFYLIFSSAPWFPQSRFYRLMNFEN